MVTMPPPPYKETPVSKPKPAEKDTEILVDDSKVKPNSQPASDPSEDSLDFDVEHSGAILPLPPVEPVEKSQPDPANMFIAPPSVDKQGEVFQETSNGMVSLAP